MPFSQVIICQSRIMIVLALGIFLALAFSSRTSLAKPEKPKSPLAFDFSLAASETFDDNVFQQPIAESDYVSEVRPGVSVEIGMIRYLKLAAKYNFKYLYYLDHSELNDIFHQFNFDIGLDLSKAKRFRNFRLGTEVHYDPVNIAATSSGGSSINTTQRFQGALIPGYNWKITPTLDLDLESRLQRTFYDGPGEGSYSGDLLATLRKRIAKRLFFRIGANGTYQKFDNAGVTIIEGINGGFDIEIIKRLNGGVTAGYQIIDLPSGDTGNAVTAAVNLEYMFSKRTTFSVVVNRSNTVDLNNNPFLSTVINLGIRHRLSIRTLIGLDMFYSMSEQQSLVAGRILSDDLNSYGGALRLQYTDRWSFALRSIRDVNGGENQANDYTQNRYTLEARYHFPLKF